ncbi:hypothetical protein [uncultured Methanolobus sp.]|uniref:hypothetical protein n=1 Tax=uncultured Methanolobus sp. TaxID=218300 RepID=UPI0029C818DA|nr:hypothetical protein [uncultured Methanolobus sp.]
MRTRELDQYLVEKMRAIDFSKPVYSVERQDSEETRQKILSISYSEWKKMVFSKGALHYMKKNAEAGKPFNLNTHVRERL